MKISKLAIVRISYELYIIEEGEKDFIEEATVEEPLIFIFQKDPMLPLFEKNLEGLSKGDKFDFLIPMKDAYGEYQEERIGEYPKSDFIIEGEVQEDALEVGSEILMYDKDGNEYPGFVIENKLNTVILDFNHPLAGGDLHFVGAVEEVEL